MRDELLVEDQSWVIERVQRRLPRARLLLTDGKSYKLERRTNDKEAEIGWASGGCAKGYKLHVLVDEGHRLLGWALHPMNHGETTACAKIIEGLAKQECKTILIGDAGYSSNPLHAIAALRNIRLIAPRAKPGTKLGNRKHHQDRVASVRLTEERGGWMWRMLSARRSGVERFFSGLATSCVGAGYLPSWVRTLRRTRLWIGAKLAINAARIVRNHEIHA